MAGKTYLGIDAGTSVVKAAIFDENGDALAVKGKPLDLTHGSGGAVEQDFNVIYAGFEEVVQAAIAEAGQRHRARGRPGLRDGGLRRPGSVGVHGVPSDRVRTAVTRSVTPLAATFRCRHDRPRRRDDHHHR